MDPSSKKRKPDENGSGTMYSPDDLTLTLEDARKIIDSFNPEQLFKIVADAMCRDAGILDDVRRIADRDPVQRKLFIRGLGWETTTEKLHSIFSNYGELEEAVVILDKATGKSKGYGFITFRHIDGAVLALREPSKKIDGRMTVTQLAAAGASGPTAPAPTTDVSRRKIYVGNVPADMSSDRLLSHFSSYGEIEEGPLGSDKQTGKFKGFTLFVYKTVEDARAVLLDPIKNIDGHTLQCRLASDGKKGRPATGAPTAGAQGQTAGTVGCTGADGHCDGLSMGSNSSFLSSFSSQFGVPGGGLSSYGGLSGSGGVPGAAASVDHHHPMNFSLQSSFGLGGGSLSSVGSHAPSSLGGSGVGGYGGGALSGGPYGSSSQNPGSGGYGGIGIGSSLYGMSPGSAGMPASGLYSSSSMYQGQHYQPVGSSPGSRVPPGDGGMYRNIPPYY